MTQVENIVDKPVVILGAGPTGLACAYQLLKLNNKLKVVVLDRAPVPGGSGASFSWNDHTLDYGPHAFHTRGDEPEALIREIFKDTPDVLIEGQKKVRVFLNGKFFKYPLQVKETLFKFNPFVSVKIVLEFLLTSIVHLIVSIPVESFEDWGRKRFGATLYKISFGDYTRKVWKTDPNSISRKFASEKIQGFSFINLIKKLFKIGGQVTEPYYQTWIYHRRGSGAMFKKLAEQIERMGGQIILNADVIDVDVKNNSAHQISFNKNQQLNVIEPQLLINTIQLPMFIGLMKGSAPFVIKHHGSKLKYISLILVYLEFNVEKIGSDNWFYLLDKAFFFNRVTEQKNLSSETMSAGKTVLSFELTCRVGDEYWNLTDEEIYSLAIEDCKKVPVLAENIKNISDHTIRRAKNVYEQYAKDFENHAEMAISYANDIGNVVTTGRRGLFLQGDMHQSVEMGMNLAKMVSTENDNALLSKENKQDYVTRYVKYID
jgi:protoporphyrinogen oxidase